MKAIDIVRSVCSVIGIAEPNSIIGSADKGVSQLRGLLEKECRSLAKRYDWEVLTREATFQTQAQEDQGSIASIIGAVNNYRRILNETMWNRSRGEPVCGPESPLDWQLSKTLGLSGPFVQYRIRGGRLLFDPAPAAGETIAFEYITRNFATSPNGEEQRASITNDEDVILLDCEIVAAGVEWRWRKSKGLDYAEEFAEYERMVADAMAQDGTKRRLSLADSHSSRERRIAISPGSWPL